MSSCLCRKLSLRQYQDISQTEAGILQEAWVEAPYLFSKKRRNADLVPPPRKRLCLSTRNPDPIQSHDNVSDDLTHDNVSDDLTRDNVSNDLTQPMSLRIASLIKTYSPQKISSLFESVDTSNILQEARTSYLRVFISIERSDRETELQLLFRRTCCYAFSKLHKNSTSVDHIVQEIQNALPKVENARDKVYHTLRVGKRWIEIVQLFGSIVGRAEEEVTGLLSLLGSPSTWERATVEERRSALRCLSSHGDILEKATQFTPIINNVVSHISADHCFINDGRRFALHTNPILSVTPAFHSSRNNTSSGAIVMRRSLHTVPAKMSAWKIPSLAAISNAIPRLEKIQTENAKILLVLLSFLSTSDDISVDMLIRGAAPRRRWTVQGEAEVHEAIHAGLDSELYKLCLETATLSFAFQELHSSSLVSGSNQAYGLDEAIALRIRESLPLEHITFWKKQTLVLTYRAIPWKYLEPTVCNIKPLLNNFKHVLQTCQDCIEQLPASTRFDLALTLIEATRYPNMSWKQFATSQAKAISRGLNDTYLTTCIAHSESLINRLTGDMIQATGCLNAITNLPRTMNQRLNSAIGQVFIQSSLNYMQVEDLSAAEKELRSWKTLDDKPSLMEETILFRRYVVLGKLFRSCGTFGKALANLRRAWEIAEQHQSINFDEDLRDLTCELADTLRELNEPVAAEDYIRKVIGRQHQNSAALPGGSLLELSLAEALFAQRRFEEAESLCMDIQTRGRLLKFEKLRLHVTLAKLRHNSDTEGALTAWSAAMGAIRKFPMTNGHTTRIIVLSMVDILRSSGQTWLVLDSMKQLKLLEELAKPGGTQFWLAGLQHWSRYLMSKNDSHL